MSSLREYERKRSFDKTREPKAEKQSSNSGRLFVIQKHRASHLHYDLRLESEGVLKSWAVPKGPSTNPAVKRLAMAVEDHPLEYAKFEGAIPEGEYGGGTVMVWDIGRYVPENGDVEDALRRGQLKFTLHGKKLKGSWVLVRTGGRHWLLIKHRDHYADSSDVTEAKPLSVLTRRTLAEIAEDEGGNVEKAATGDPEMIPQRSRVKRGHKGSHEPRREPRTTKEHEGTRRDTKETEDLRRVSQSTERTTNHEGTRSHTKVPDRFSIGVETLNRIFILSPAHCGGLQAQMLMAQGTSFPLAQQLRSRGVSLGAVFTFLSGLYFRGKLAYAQAFAKPPEDVPGILIITPGRGLVPPEELITFDQLREFATVEVSERNPFFRRPLEQDAGRIAESVSLSCETVLLGSVATSKYLGVLSDILGERLKFPAEFVGRGDMSRGGLLLRCAESGEQLQYITVPGAVRHGPRPPKLSRRR